MEMCYSGALVMPSSYAVMDEEEMTYVDGGKSTWVSYSSVSAAYSAHAQAGSAFHYFAVGLGVAFAAFGTIVGTIKGLGNLIIGAIIGGTGGLIAGSVVWGWGTKFHDCANELYQKNGTSRWSKSCKIKWYNIGTDLYYSINY